MTDIELKPIYSGRIINPHNIEIEKRQSAAFELSLVELFRLRRQQRNIYRRLEQRGYWSTLAVYRSLRDQFDNLMRERAVVLSDLEIAEPNAIPILQDQIKVIEYDIDQLMAKGATLAKSLRKHAKLALSEKRLSTRLEQHYLAVDRAKAARKTRRVLMQDVADIEQIIIGTLTHLRQAHYYTVAGRERVQRVRISERHANADTIYLKVETMRKGWFGWIPSLPYGVSPVKLAEDEIVASLAIACQRQIDAVKTRANGLWYRIHRLSSADGIINFLAYRDTRAVYERTEKHRLPICLGIGKARLEYVLELAHYPHYLIAGTSGAGKSNQVRNMICTLISNYSPDEVQLVLVDMKEGVEFKIYEDQNVPHLVGNVIKSPSEFSAALKALEQIRTERSEKFASVYAIDLNQYNERVPASERLPRIVLMIDEFASIYMDNADNDERENKRIANRCKAYIRQLLAKARAAGIHVIICTQTVYVEILPGPDKANISVKMCGRMPTKASSMVVLDNGDAADLPDDPRGRMIVSTSGYQFVLQTPYVSPDDVLEAINIAKLNPRARNAVKLKIEEQSRQQFTQDDAISLVLSEYDGQLSADKIWRGGLRDSKLIEWRTLIKMMAELKELETIEHDGKVYSIERDGKSRRLKLQNTILPVGLLTETIVEGT